MEAVTWQNFGLILSRRFSTLLHSPLYWSISKARAISRPIKSDSLGQEPWNQFFFKAPNVVLIHSVECLSSKWTWAERGTWCRNFEILDCTYGCDESNKSPTWSEAGETKLHQGWETCGEPSNSVTWTAWLLPHSPSRATPRASLQESCWWTTCHLVSL